MRSRALLDELTWRGLLVQQTEGVSDALDRGPMVGYAGFDPTADSLHVGHLVPVMGLVHLQRHGHQPIALVGGGTGRIGDPSGKSAERTLSDYATIEANTRALAGQLRRFLSFDGPGGARLVDNADWLVPLHAIDFMRDVGKHFTVNYMLQKESVRSRMDSGISFTEFSYMLLQAYDFLELHRRHGATLQVGGSDQWGNITAGTTLIRSVAGGEAHGITFPLVTTASGVKFGKTESGAVWLDAERTSPYRFFQFWINTDDRDVGRYLRYFTLLSREEVETLDAAAATAPERREAQRALARDVTARVHGAEALRAAEEVSALLFGGAEPGGLSVEAIRALEREIPVMTLAGGTDALTTGDIIDATSAGEQALFKSKGDARRMLQQGGVYLNGRRLPAEREPLAPGDLLHGRYALVRKGSRSYALVVAGS
jgi:tyrosyl-tRNA synthetase